MEKWMEDLKMAVDMAEESNGLTADLLSASKDVSKWHMIRLHLFITKYSYHSIKMDPVCFLSTILFLVQHLNISPHH